MSPLIMAQAHLTGSQRKALRELISLKTDMNELRIFIRDELDLRLNDLANLSNPWNVVVFDVLEKLEIDEMLVRFIESLMAGMPKLKAELVSLFGGGEVQPPAPPLPADLHRFGAAFRERREWLVYLNAYKELHELLHSISGIVPQLQEEAAGRANQGIPIPETTADDLKEWAQESEIWAAKTEEASVPRLKVWVERFNAAVEDFLGPDPSIHARGLANIARLPSQQLDFLNSQLVACARRLEVKVLVDLLDELPIAALGLTDAVANFREPCVRLRALIEDHDLCQRIDTELRLATGSSAISPETILGWGDVQGWLGELAQGRQGDSRVSRTRRVADTFQQSPSASTFRDLIEKFDDLFKRTDEALLRVTSQLVLAAESLADELEGLR